MKKRNAKSLKLNKNSISDLGKDQTKGGTLVSKYNCPTLQNPPCTSFIDACPTAWCPFTQVPKDCVYW